MDENRLSEAQKHLRPKSIHPDDSIIWMEGFEAGAKWSEGQILEKIRDRGLIEHGGIVIE